MTKQGLSREVDLAIADGCRLNLLWLVEGLARGRALELVSDGPSLAAALRDLFDQVDSAEQMVDDLQLPFASATFDAVTVYGRGLLPAGMAEVRRVLKPRGAALIVGPNRWWWRCLSMRREPGQAVSARTTRRQVESAGFSEARAYWLEPSLATPRSLIPDTKKALAAHEAMRTREHGHDAVRSLALRTGLHRLLFPAVAVVARA